VVTALEHVDGAAIVDARSAQDCLDGAPFREARPHSQARGRGGSSHGHGAALVDAYAVFEVARMAALVEQGAVRRGHGDGVAPGNRRAPDDSSLEAAPK
jgi:hypothetical protein